MSYLSRLCPCCGSSRPQKLAVVSTVPAERLGYAELKPIWNGFFKEKSFFSYVRCPNCYTLYAPEFFTPEQLGDLYGNMPANMDVVPFDLLRSTQRGYFTIFKRYSTLTGGYVEIGADVGLFTENCVREGRFDHYWLFEPNHAVEPALHATMGGASHEVIHEMFDLAAVPDAAASAVVMIHVLDHLLDPAAMLGQLRKKLADGGVLLIVTHDESSLLRRLAGSKWPAFCLQHPQIYSAVSMRALLRETGFKVLEISKTVNYFPLTFLWKHLLWACGLKVRRAPSFGGLSVGLQLGNIITVATNSR
ncbi:MAG: class I SAM-dependent methyltransferase [Bradyrhizobium sp.]|nr:class I SAM-dependent methyltransferase [Bradyrhizobium sp.]